MIRLSRSGASRFGASAIVAIIASISPVSCSTTASLIAFFDSKNR